jgi:diguanylate cyclase (GGDEF)-like protein
MMMRHEEQYELDEYVGASFVFLAATVIMFIRREWQLRVRLTASSVREQSAHDAARTDYLTGLPNRLALMERMKQLGRKDIVFLLIDLDGFKEINDRYGHAAGDAVIQEVSRRLQNIARSITGSFAARLGGDEFGCILPIRRGTDDATVRRVIATKLEEPINLPSGEVSVGASIGSAVSIGGELSSDQLLDLSDSVMYREKFLRRVDGQASSSSAKPGEPVPDAQSASAVYRRYRTLEMLRDGLMRSFPSPQGAEFEDLLARLEKLEAPSAGR